MNSDIWLPTAPARMLLTKPPVNTESALRMHANQRYISVYRRFGRVQSVIVVDASSDRPICWRGRLLRSWELTAWQISGASGGPAGFEDASSRLVLLHPARVGRGW